MHAPVSFLFFFFNDTATTEIYTLSLHDALPILLGRPARACEPRAGQGLPRPDPRLPRADRQSPGRRRPPAKGADQVAVALALDRKSTRLNSSHSQISYAVFCLKKKKNTQSDSSASEKKTPKRHLPANTTSTIPHPASTPAPPATPRATAQSSRSYSARVGLRDT